LNLPRSHKENKTWAISPHSPAQALSDLEIVLKCLKCRFSEEIAGAASMGDQFLLHTIL